MNITEAQTVLAILTAAYWQGRTMPVETAKLYAQELADLDFQDVADAVKEIIDNDTEGFFPPIGKIRETAKEWHSLRNRKPEKPLLPTGPIAGSHGPVGWLRAAPWFVRLQIARQRAGEPAGFPVTEFREGGVEALKAECATRRVDASDFDWWTKRL